MAALAHTTTASAQSFEVRPFDAPLGAEIIGLDLTRPLGDENFACVHRAHLDHGLLVFREQRITFEQQIAFSRRFGPLQIHVLIQFLLADHPEIFIISNIVENGRPIGLGWYIFQNRNELHTGKVCAGLAAVILIGLLVENLVFATVERVAVKRWGMQRQESERLAAEAAPAACEAVSRSV